MKQMRLKTSIKTGVKAKEIANKNFPILNANMTFEEFLSRLDKKQEAYAIMKNGKLHSILSYEELLKAFLTRKKKIILEDLKQKNFVFVSGETDASDILDILKKGLFAVVKEPLSIITKKEITEMNPELFSSLEK